MLPDRVSNPGPRTYLQAKKQQIPTWYRRRNDTFCANRPLTGDTITFIRCLYRVTGVSIGQGEIYRTNSMYWDR